MPVRFGLKHSRNQTAILYVVVNQNAIERSNLTETKRDTDHKAAASDLTEVNELLSRATYSIPQIIKFVNSRDVLRYIPDEMLSTTQREAKWEAIADTIKRTNNKNDDIRYQYADNEMFKEDKCYAKKIDKFESLNDTSYITVGMIKDNSPLNRIGMTSGNLYFDVSKIRAEISKHQDHLTKTVLKDIPKLLNNPIVVVEYRGGENQKTANVYGELYYHGTSITVGIVATLSRGNTVISKVRTIHARSDFAKQITDDPVLFLCENKKETDRWFQAQGQPVPMRGTKYGLIRSIYDITQNVKINQKLSEVLDNSKDEMGDVKAQYADTSNYDFSKHFEQQAERFDEHSVQAALWNSMSHKDEGYDNLIRVSKMPSYIVNKFEIDGDFYIYRDHAYENMVSAEQAQEDNRFNRNAHYHNLGIDTMTSAILSLDNPIMTISTKSKEGNPTVIMLLPVFGNNQAPLYAVLSFYMNKHINGNYTRKPHIVLTIAERGFFGSGGRAGISNVVKSAIEDGRVLDFDNKKREDLSVIAKSAGLGNITESSLMKSLTQFRKEVKAFKKKMTLTTNTATPMVLLTIAHFLQGRLKAQLRMISRSKS